jgi:hypothetical protein
MSIAATVDCQRPPRIRQGRVATQCTQPVPQSGKPWLALVLLAGYLVFCHGCHGDEDNELFALLGKASAVSERSTE